MKPPATELSGCMLQWFRGTGNMSDCSVWDLGIESYCWQSVCCHRYYCNTPLLQCI